MAGLSYAFVNDQKVKIHRCPQESCPYFEVWDLDRTNTLFYCKHRDCGEHSCIVCRAICGDTYLLKYHEQICAPFQKWKTQIEALVEANSMRECPNIRINEDKSVTRCGYRGVKDEGCTHMTCARCREQWCYLCGKTLAQLDKSADSKGSIYGHNVNWKINSNRCPMFLHHIAEVDSKWPNAAYGSMSVNTLHVHLLKSALNGYFKTVNLQDFQEIKEMLAACPSILPFSLQEITTYAPQKWWTYRVPLDEASSQVLDQAAMEELQEQQDLGELFDAA